MKKGSNNPPFSLALFVTNDERVKILDFGLAKLQPQQFDGIDKDAPTQKRITDPGVIMGAVGYLSPEQVRGQETGNSSWYPRLEDTLAPINVALNWTAEVKR